MCLFVSATLPHCSDAERIASLPDLPLSFERVSNPAIERQLFPGEAYFALSGLERGGCYCDTVLGSGTQQESAVAWSEKKVARKAARLRKNGWSEAKVQAWLEQKHQKPTTTQGGEAGRAEALEWLRLADLVLKQGKVKHLGLLLHFYRRDVANEAFELRFEELALEELDEARLRRLHEDVLYRISL